MYENVRAALTSRAPEFQWNHKTHNDAAQRHGIDGPFQSCWKKDTIDVDGKEFYFTEEKLQWKEFGMSVLACMEMIKGRKL